MEHKGTVKLETERLFLRRFIQDDAEAVYNNWTSDETVTRYLSWPKHSDVSVTKSLMEYYATRYDDPAFYQWAMVLKDEGDEPIGTVSVVKTDEDTDMVEVGYCTSSKYWHKGYTSEALKAIIKFLFEEVKVVRIEAKHDTQNPNSGKVMLKCGMQYEGTLRKSNKNNRGLVDSCLYAIIDEDFNNEQLL